MLPKIIQKLDNKIPLVNRRLISKKPLFLARAAGDYLIRNLFDRKKLKSVLFASHYKCNLNCCHCYEKSFLRTDKIPLTTKEKISILKQCIDIGVLAVDFIGGETILDKDFSELIRACKPDRTYITLGTNGYDIDEEKIRQFVDIGIDKLNISIDSWFAEEHDTFRRKAGAYKKAMSAVELCKKHGLNVNIATVVARDGTQKEGFKKLVEYAIATRTRLVTIAAVALGNWEGQHDFLISETDKEILRFLHDKYPFITRNCVGGGSSPCPACREMIAITAYGDVLPCDFIPITIGNLRHENISAILAKAARLPYFSIPFKGCLPAENSLFIKECLTKTYNKFPYPVPAAKIFKLQPKKIKKIRVLRYNLKTLVNYQQKKVYLDTPPTFLWIEPTNKCNLSCIMCPTGAGHVTIEKGFMEYTLFTAIIDEISSYASSIILAVLGESLLHPRIYEMIRYASDQGIKVQLNTNTTLLTPEKAQMMLDSGIYSINFSFDGYNENMYSQIRVNSNFQKTLDNLMYFLELKIAKKQNIPYTTLSMIDLGVGNYTDDEKKIFIAKFDGLVDEIRHRAANSWGEFFAGTNNFTYQKLEKYFPPCGRLWGTVAIKWNGDVVPCVYNANHDYVLGNIRKDSLWKIWNGEKAIRLRQAMLDDTYLKISPVCYNCIVIKSPHLLGVPSGLRMSLNDAFINFAGIKFERTALYIANKFTKNKFATRTMRN